MPKYQRTSPNSSMRFTLSIGVPFRSEANEELGDILAQQCEHRGAENPAADAQIPENITQLFHEVHVVDRRALHDVVQQGLVELGSLRLQTTSDMDKPLNLQVVETCGHFRAHAHANTELVRPGM